MSFSTCHKVIHDLLEPKCFVYHTQDSVRCHVTVKGFFWIYVAVLLYRMHET